jgi:hypothetical protein
MKLTEHEQWCVDKGVGWTATMFWEYLERNNIHGPYTDHFRSQYLRYGECTFEEDDDLQNAHRLNDNWPARQCEGL